MIFSRLAYFIFTFPQVYAFVLDRHAGLDIWSHSWRKLMNPITDEMLENWFTYHTPTAKQQLDYVTLREVAKHLALVIRDLAPACADTTAAIRKVREAVMTANQAIACGGK